MPGGLSVGQQRGLFILTGPRGAQVLGLIVLQGWGLPPSLAVGVLVCVRLGWVLGRR